MFEPLRPVTSAWTSPLRQPHVAVDADAADLQQPGIERQVESAVAGVDDHQHERDGLEHVATITSARQRRLRARLATRARRKFFSVAARDLHRRPPFAAGAAGRCAAPRGSVRRRVPIDPAPSVITRSPGRARPATAAGNRRARARRARPPRAACAHLGRQGVEGHAGNRRLSGGVDVGQHDLVGAAERARRTRASALCVRAVAVRLEHDDDPPVDAGARRGNHGGNLGRVMAVVVDDHHAVLFAEPLESALGALELRRARRQSVRTGCPTSSPTATAASALSRLCRPGTCSRSSPSSTVASRACGWTDGARAERLERHAVAR